MKHLLGFHSIRQKLSIGVLLSTLLALFIAGAIIVFYDLRDYRERLLEDMRTQADLIGQASIAALQFNDREVANQTLALLRLRPRIIAAAIYTPEGEVFARYHVEFQQTDTLPDLPLTESLSRGLGEIGLPRRIMFNDQTLGHIYLLGEYPFYQRLLRDISIIFAVMLLALTLSMLLSFWIQSRITRPILDVSRLARYVVKHQDYSVRAEKAADDETGNLVDAFNNMLAEIEHRTEALQQSNQQLSQEITERNMAEQA
ncbi:MAG: CHASE sensor domain-containing protein, partial [Methylophaga sp.]